MGKKFDRLARKVEKEYEREGYDAKKAREWGNATAGKVFREKEAHECTRCSRCGSPHNREYMMHFCKKCGSMCT